MTVEGPRQTSAEVSFDSRVYALTVIKKAAYRFLSRFVTDIRQDGDAWTCTLQFVDAADSATADELVRELKSEVLDQDLRATIARETEPVRNAVLALAFSRTGLQSDQ